MTNGKKTERTRQATKTPTAEKRTPSPGCRFPSAVLGDNLRALRQLRKLRQEDLAELMRSYGFPGWSRVTVSDVERGIRATSVDELFGLALILKTYVVKLIDPAFGGSDGPGIDLGVAYPDQDNPVAARELILPQGDPWQLERGPHVSFSDHLAGMDRGKGLRKEREAGKMKGGRS